MSLDLRVRLLGKAVAWSTGPIAGMSHDKRERLRNPTAPRRLVEWLNGRRASGVTAADITIPGPGGEIPARVYRPADWAPPSGLPVVVAFHGGGFVFGNLDTGDWLCSNVCARTPAVVVSVSASPGVSHHGSDAFVAVDQAASSRAAAAGSRSARLRGALPRSHR